jgi:hypothetical protein
MGTDGSEGEHRPADPNPLKRGEARGQTNDDWPLPEGWDSTRGRAVLGSIERGDRTARSRLT